MSLFQDIAKNDQGRVIGRQFLRSGTAIGANVFEARAARTRKEFFSTIRIALKEACETYYWIQLIKESKIIDKIRVERLSKEVVELQKILTTIIKNGKTRDNC